MLSSPLLHVRGLSKSFRGVQALQNYQIDLAERELIGVIGPNGAGKTTLFNLLTGVVAPSHGRIVFGGRDITHASPEAICRVGIARTFQNIRLFRRLSVLDNVSLGLRMRRQPSLHQIVLRLPGYALYEHRLHQRALELLDLFHLAGYASQQADTLPYGLQRRMDIVQLVISVCHANARHLKSRPTEAPRSHSCHPQFPRVRETATRLV
jgi:branched-chain amino acid transport system ATP-binding protein